MYAAQVAAAVPEPLRRYAVWRNDRGLQSGSLFAAVRVRPYLPGEGLPGGKPVASSPLVFPDQALFAKTHQYYVFTGTSDLDQWNNTFDPIITG